MISQSPPITRNIKQILSVFQVLLLQTINKLSKLEHEIQNMRESSILQQKPCLIIRNMDGSEMIGGGRSIMITV